MFDLLRRHFLDHLFLADCRVGVSSDCAEDVPCVRSHKIGRRQADANFIIPADTRLRARVPFQCTAQIPIKGSHGSTINAQTKRIHDADQFFGVGISGSGRRPKRLACLFELACFHQIARVFDFRFGWQGQGTYNT